MASSSSPSHTKRYDVFSSFHGPGVRKGFLSHLHTHFASKGIRTFKDQEIERGHTIGPELVQAIRESRVSIVVLSKKYASSSWCLDELVEILKCKEDFGQIVITIFYEVDPSDVRKQRGDFGSAFEKTCQGKSEEVKQRWSKALADVATIAGEHSLNWYNEAEMIQKVATDVSKKLNVTPSRDFEGIVGFEAHLNKLDSLLCLESDEVKMIGIWGPAGIGKSTIARALFNQVSSSFQLSCFMGNLKGSYKSTMGVDDYDSKLSLQNQLLSKILNQRDMRVHHLGSIKEGLQYQRVLIVLDDVDDLEQLEALAKEPSWFGSGSRIIVTTKDQNILKAHGVYDIYHVDFPSKKEALEKSNNAANFINSIAVEGMSVTTEISLEQIEKSHDSWLSKLQENASMDSSRSDGILWDTKRDRNPKEAEIVLAEAKSKRDDDGLNLSKDEDRTFGIKQRLKELGDKFDLNKIITSHLGMIIGWLLLLTFCVAYMSTPFTGEGGAINGIVENEPKVLEYVPTERTENPRDKYTEFPRGEFRAKPESSSSDAKTNADLLERTCSCSPLDGKVKPPNIQVFINFRGDLRNNFTGSLVRALQRSEINVFIDNHEQIGEDQNILFQRIEDSGIAIVVFSSSYTKSKWCLDELVKIKERVHQGLLKVLPIFYKVSPAM